MGTNFFLASPSGSSHAPSTTPSRSISPLRALSPPTLDRSTTTFTSLSQPAHGAASPSRSSSSSSLSGSNLPFAAPLPRSDFLQPDFDPSAYLSQLFSSTTRHQTLEDLRAELRGRSSQLNQELLDLVNTHYADFLELGERVKGGQEKVEGLAVGVLGFQREVEGLLAAVEERAERVRGLLEERRAVQEGIEVGRALVEVDGVVSGLERRLMLGEKERKSKKERDGVSGDREAADEVREGSDEGGGSEGEEEEGEEEFLGSDIDTLSGSSEDDDDDDDERVLGESGRAGANTVAAARLAARVRDYTSAEQLCRRAGVEHPFVRELRPRLSAIREALLLDLGAALKEARAAGKSAKVLRLLRMYSELDADDDAVAALKMGK